MNLNIIKNRYSIILILLCLSLKNYSQCTSNTSLYPAATFTPNCNGTSQNITTAGYATEYSMVYVTSGTTYTFSSSVSTDYLTIANSAGGAPVYAFGTTPVIWTATITGPVRFYDNTNSSCGTNTSFRTRSVMCGTPPAAPANDNCAGSFTVPVNPSTSCASTQTATSVNATQSQAGCTGTADDDVWFSFIATSAAHVITITPGTMSDVVLQTFSGTCAGLTSLGCTDATGTSNPETITLGGLTTGATYYFRVYSYASGTGMGTFTACITTPAAPPANDNCSGSFTVPVNASVTCAATTTATSASATQSQAGCTGTADDDVWFSFTASATSHIVTVTPGTMSDVVLQTFSGTCGSLTSLGCTDNTGTTNPETITLSGLTIGVVYYFRVYSYGNGSGTGTFTACITTPNNPCNSPTNITSCSTTINATIAAGTGLYGSSACGWTTAGNELIYTFTPATTGAYKIQQFSSFTYIDYMYKAVSAGCSSTGWTCVFAPTGASTSSGFNLTAGVQYYFLLDPESTAGGNVSFSIICPPTPPANDNCAGAFSVSPNSGSTCTSLTNGTIYGATATSFTNACGGTADDDVWYSFVASSSTHSISITNVAGSTTDMYHSLYSGSCASLGNPLVCSDPNTSSVSGLILGNTYYVRVYTWTSTPGQTSTFSVCITTPPPTGPCGNPANNDYCSNPATLTQGAGSFSSTTSGTFSADLPGNVGSIFCGSVENNSWYSFVATGATASFPFTSISGCTWGDGVQAQVYAVSTNSIGCCTSFTSVSNCYNPGSTSTGTVNATGLTAGQTYLLMVDGFAGDVCNFTVSNWTAVGILPLNLMTFVGENAGTQNKIEWVTGSERNTDYFVLEKSKNGNDFEPLLNLKAAEYSTSPKNYKAFDMNPFEEITYYRLKLFNRNATFEYSNVIAINNTNLTDYVTNLHPNPTTSNIEFDVNTTSKNKISVEVINNTGSVVGMQQFLLNEGYNNIKLSLEKFDSGIYLAKISFENSGKIVVEKIIKR